MKVYIGPYVNWIGPYQISNFLFKWLLGEKRSDAIGKWLAENTPVEDICQKIHDKRQRKIKVKLHTYDSWNADDTLAHIILPVLKKIKEAKHGSPIVEDKDVPKALRSTSAPKPENEWETDENFHKRWEYVIDEMIFAFSSIVENQDMSDFASGVHDLKSVGFDKDGNRTDDEDLIAWYSFEEGPNHTFKVDDKALKVWETRRANGFRLFGKYYLSLWT